MHQSRRDVLTGLIASATLAAAPAWGIGMHDHGDAPAAIANPLATSAAIDHKGRLWVAYVERTGPGANILLRWTADEGKTWSPARKVLRTPEMVEANGEGRPKLAFGAAGQIYLTYTRQLNKPHTGDIRFVRSMDGATSFSEPVTIQRDREVTGHRFDSMIVDRQGRVFIAWIDKRDGNAARAEQRPYRGAAIYYAVSTDQGASFGPDVRLADHSCECCRIALSLNSRGDVVAMWRHVFEPNVRDHAMAVLSPSGSPAALTRVSHDNWALDACPHHGPSLAFDASGRRHQVWFNGANDDGGVFYASAPAASAPGTPLQLGGAQAEHGEVAASGNNVTVVWKEFDGQSTRAVARISADGGTSWCERVLATTQGSSDHPHLVSRGTGIWLVWNTEKESIVVRRADTQS